MHAFGNDLGQQLPGPSDKGFALFILFVAWPFTHKHDLCVGIADPEDDTIAFFTQTTALAVADFGSEFCERVDRSQSGFLGWGC